MGETDAARHSLGIFTQTAFARAAHADEIQQLVDSLDGQNEQDAAQRFYDTLVGDLRTFEVWALIAAVVVAVVIYLFDHFYMQPKSRADGALGTGA